MIKERNLVHQTVKFQELPKELPYRYSLNSHLGKVDEVGVRTPPESYIIPHPSYDQPAFYQEREIVIGNSTYPLPATLTVRNIKLVRRYHVVVLVHGAGIHDRDSTYMGTKIFTRPCGNRPTELQCCAMKNAP